MTDAPLSDIPVIVPAAGLSRRMRGTDKLMLAVDGMPLLRRQVVRVRAATSGDVVVTLPPTPHPRYDALDGLDVVTVPVPDATEGMSASLRRGLAALDDATRAVMILLPDLPDLTVADLRRVLAAVDLSSNARIWCAGTPDGRPGHPMVVHATLFDLMRDAVGDTGARAIRDEAAHAGTLSLVALEDDRARRDLDTPKAWAAWQAARKKPDPATETGGANPSRFR